VVEAGHLLVPAVDLAQGAVHVQRHRRAGRQLHLAVEAVAQLDHRRHHCPALAEREPLQQLPGRGRRRCRRHRPQLGAGQIAAQLIEVDQVVAAHRDRLGQRDHQLAGVQAALPLLELTGPIDRLLDRLHHLQAADELTGEEQAGVAGQGGVVVPDLDAGAGAGTWGRMRAHSKVPPTRVA
jgi:hypothetical protein